MWVVRLLDMTLEELRVEGLIERPLQAGFGQEGVVIGATAALGEGDIATTTHRPHALQVGLGNPLGSMIAEMIGRIVDPEYGLPASPGAASQSPLLAIGYAYSQWLDDHGRVTLCATEDSDVDASTFHEAANMAVLWQLPVVILVENIRCALSVRLGRPDRDSQLYRRAAGYGMPGVSVDGNDVESVRDCVARAVERARAGGGPTLVQAITYRTTDFSGSDRGGYRDLAGSEQFLDPLVFARRRLLAAGVTRGQLDETERVARDLVADALAYAKARPHRDNGGPWGTGSQSDGQTESRS
ncbi:dehydrogenase [Mycobacterium lacus]|uniref:Dehydrogenase n=2 Tax=Mycobacterium lacus TaxID=169765 RepID=A0A7I7NHE0_9MYCO|nr:thiamine pyrophosphate-dependent enzyme [Mycobacterium lacus]MCV7124811.1 thiamine pyrophosphate-dependent dehydrogenase E1 component subunit alpha [Mycobacterium lacus]BBX94917.1 dehydrogenase [Mycobacterium lacus]